MSSMVPNSTGLNAALNRLLNEYPAVSNTKFANNPFTSFVRTQIPDIIRNMLNLVGSNERYLVAGSAGAGNWANVPWIAVMDRLVTDSVQSGYYVVYLIKEDCSGIYLALGQGADYFQKKYGTKFKEPLRAKAEDFKAILGDLVKGLDSGPISLVNHKSAGRGESYEIGTICAKFYAKNKIPDDTQLLADLRKFQHLYLTLVSEDISLSDAGSLGLGLIESGVEDLRNLRTHLRIDRNRKLAEQAKKVHGCTCQACGFNFEVKYGELGRGFIEAHHLTPLASLTGQLVTLDPKVDFAVLCSNCHQMIHKSSHVGDVTTFRVNHIRPVL